MGRSSKRHAAGFIACRRREHYALTILNQLPTGFFALEGARLLTNGTGHCVNTSSLPLFGCSRQPCFKVFIKDVVFIYGCKCHLSFGPIFLR